ncbi:MAG: DNA repair protein RadA [Clostridiales bacterium]|jgi:DNA repair protein RadA/Sms|nr:DNA repair protein RadA [Clostridiales bacterium]
MAKLKTVFICRGCGYETPKWAGMCPQCKMYNTFEEYTNQPISSAKASSLSSAAASVVSLPEAADTSNESRTPTNISELDRVLNGGIVEGSVILLGGEPGIGKSTLLLQICESVGIQGVKILYASGEESVTQIKMRANRLNVSSENISLTSEANLRSIEAAINSVTPDIVLIDSIQTVYNEDIPSTPGSVTQVRECTQYLIRLAKKRGVSVILVGHVTKDGAIAGPKILEHMVDTVLYFEGERHASYRIIRTVKNRFGPANEIGVFEMRGSGLAEILNPSEYMLSGRPKDAAGSVVTASMEGSRPILTEVQALISYTNFSTPRRSANGVDYNRAVMLMAVLEKRLGFKLSTYDSYVNIAGGLKVTEPAADLALAAAISGSYKNIAVDTKTMIFGEVGLTGEVRAVTRAEKRVQEAVKFGFTHCLIPQANLKENRIAENKGVHVYGISNIAEMMGLLF